MAAVAFLIFELSRLAAGLSLLPWGRLRDGVATLTQAPGATKASAYLWLKYVGHSTGFASGISAFPSIHVALAGWMVLAAHLVRPWFKPVMWAYFSLVCVGSVYLGWHYFADVLGGAFGLLAAYRLSAYVIDWRSKTQRQVEWA